MVSQVANIVADKGKVGVEQLQTEIARAVDITSAKAEEVGAEINTQLCQASDSIAEQTKTSQDALEVSRTGSPRSS